MKCQLAVKLHIEPHSAQWLDLMPDSGLDHSEFILVEDDDLFTRLVNSVLKLPLKYHYFSPYPFFGLMLFQ